MIKDAQTILAAILTKIIKPYVSVHPIGRDLYVMFKTFILLVLPKLKFTLIYYGPLWISYDVDYMILTRGGHMAYGKKSGPDSMCETVQIFV